MKNIHLQHPEDSILTGDLSALNCFINPSHLSVKFDGRPAIVWGSHPQTGKTFVGTKSVFNKKKIKVNYTVEDIERNHGDRPELVMILTACLECIPPTNHIYQGDFIGFGGGQGGLHTEHSKLCVPECGGRDYCSCTPYRILC